MALGIPDDDKVHLLMEIKVCVVGIALCPVPNVSMNVSVSG